MQSKDQRWDLPKLGLPEDLEEEPLLEDGVARMTSLPRMRNLSAEEKEALRRSVLGLAKKPESVTSD